jgi:hypothetical protein
VRDDIGSIVISFFVLLVVVVSRPRAARCPHGMWLDCGVRSSGDYECVPLTPEQGRTGPRGGWVDTSSAPAVKIFGRVFCEMGERARTVDGATVFCGAIGGVL